MKQLNDSFEIAGLKYERIPARPAIHLDGYKSYKFGEVVLDVFVDTLHANFYSRAYLSETGEVAWYTTKLVEGVSL